MIVDHVWYLWLILLAQVLAVRRCGDMEGLHALLEGRADTAARLLRRIHMMWLDGPAEALLGGQARNLARPNRRIVLQL